MERLFYFLGLWFMLSQCSVPAEKELTDSEPVAEEEKIVPPSVSDTTITYELSDFSSEVRIKAPTEPFTGTILVLQGWNFPNTSWSDSSNLEKLASDAGFVLVMPEMGKSIYHKLVYPQTRKDWKKYPTRTWLVDTMIVDLQQRFNLFSDKHSNFVMGLSTGGRGAFIIAQENPDVFSAGASLSGDYDQSAYPGDNLYRGYFGSYSKLWNSNENPLSFADQWSVPMYFAHGTADSIVPIKHQLILEEFSNNYPEAEEWIFLKEENSGHNYTFWRSQTQDILSFFEKFLED